MDSTMTVFPSSPEFPNVGLMKMSLQAFSHWEKSSVRDYLLDFEIHCCVCALPQTALVEGWAWQRYWDSGTSLRDNFISRTFWCLCWILFWLDGEQSMLPPNLIFSLSLTLSRCSHSLPTLPGSLSVLLHGHFFNKVAAHLILSYFLLPRGPSNIPAHCLIPFSSGNSDSIAQLMLMDPARTSPGKWTSVRLDVNEGGGILQTA